MTEFKPTKKEQRLAKKEQRLAKKEQLLAPLFYEALLFMKDQLEHHGWKKASSNYLREHVRCRFGMSFSNTISPRVLRVVRREHPELRHFIAVHKLKIQGD
jgi:hypothetical protein